MMQSNKESKLPPRDWPALNLFLGDEQSRADGNTGVHVGYGVFDLILPVLVTGSTVQTQLLGTWCQGDDVLVLSHLSASTMYINRRVQKTTNIPQQLHWCPSSGNRISTFFQCTLQWHVTLGALQSADHGNPFLKVHRELKIENV